MSRVDNLARIGRSSTAKFHELRLKYWTPDNDVICCFEGGDDVEFFLPHVRQKMVEQSIDFLICEGKSTVLKLWDEATNRSWNLARIAFFVDRDLDDFINGNPQNSRVHVTQHYSFESHCLDEGFFQNVWQDLFRLSFADDRYPIWRDAYFEGATRFAKLLFPIFYVALATKKGRGDVDFDKIKLPDIVNISDTGFVRRVGKKERYNLNQVFPNGYPPRRALRECREDLAKENFRVWLRGKFALWYAITFFARMKVALARRGQPNRASVKAIFNDENSISCLCSRAASPATVVTFLGNWLSEIEKNGTEAKGVPR